MRRIFTLTFGALLVVALLIVLPSAVTDPELVGRWRGAAQQSASSHRVHTRGPLPVLTGSWGSVGNGSHHPPIVVAATGGDAAFDPSDARKMAEFTGRIELRDSRKVMEALLAGAEEGMDGYEAGLGSSADADEGSQGAGFDKNSGIPDHGAAGDRAGLDLGTAGEQSPLFGAGGDSGWDSDSGSFGSGSGGGGFIPVTRGDDSTGKDGGNDQPPPAPGGNTPSSPVLVTPELTNTWALLLLVFPFLSGAKSRLAGHGRAFVQ